MNTKWSVYPAVVVTCLLGTVGLVLVWLQFTVSIESIEPDSSPPLPRESSSTVSTEVVEDAPLSSSEVDGQRSAQGSLRISNQSDQPVRVVFLTKQAEAKSGGKPIYATPAHWDFAPGEGSVQGLTLSLPEGNLKPKKGDILVAFAQDGSRRYWGPYVVGETPIPTWNQKTSEWQLLILQP